MTDTERLQQLRASIAYDPHGLMKEEVWWLLAQAEAARTLNLIADHGYEIRLRRRQNDTQWECVLMPGLIVMFGDSPGEALTRALAALDGAAPAEGGGE